jgi:hypothetical protein
LETARSNGCDVAAVPAAIVTKITIDRSIIAPPLAARSVAITPP